MQHVILQGNSGSPNGKRYTNLSGPSACSCSHEKSVSKVTKPDDVALHETDTSHGKLEANIGMTTSSYSYSTQELIYHYGGV